MQSVSSTIRPAPPAGKFCTMCSVVALTQWLLASPALVDGTWYFRTPFHLMAVGK